MPARDLALILRHCRLGSNAPGAGHIPIKMGTGATVPINYRSRFPPLRAESDQFLHLDFLRIFAALAVVVFHWRGAITNPAWKAAADHLDFLNVFVDLFFIISGYVIASVYRNRMQHGPDFRIFLQRRVARLLPLHWLTLLAYLVIAEVFPRLGFRAADPAKYDLHCIVPNLTLTQSLGLCGHASFNFPSWSISAEMVCYVLIPVWLLMLKRRWWLPAALGAVVIAVLFSLDQARGPRTMAWYDRTFDFGVLRALPEFALGVSLAGFRRWLERIPHPEPLMFGLLLALLLAGLAGVPHAWLMLGPMAIVIAATAADIQRSTGGLVRTVAPLGALTYSIYMLHLLVQTVLFSLVASRLLHLHGVALGVWSLFALAVLLAVSYLSYLWFETPARRWLGQVPGRRQSRLSPAVQAAQELAP